MRNHKLRPSIAVRNYDSIRPLVVVDVQIDGVDSIFMLQDPDEIFSCLSAPQTTISASYRSAATR